MTEAEAKQRLGLVRWVVARYYGNGRQGFTFDELVSFGVMGMLSASRRWDPGRCAFTTFAVPRIRGAIADELRAAARHAVPTVPLDAPLHPASVLTVADTVADDTPLPHEQVVADEDAAELEALIAALPEREEFTVRMRREGVRGREIGEALGVTESMASLYYKRGVERMCEAVAA